MGRNTVSDGPEFSGVRLAWRSGAESFSRSQAARCPLQIGDLARQKIRFPVAVREDRIEVRMESSAPGSRMVAWLRKRMTLLGN
jgi:hypothetical protein